MAANDLVAALRVQESGSGFEGVAPGWWGPYLFGGFIVGQAVFAAALTVPRDRRIHSLHAYFLLPVQAERPLCHRVTTVRDGRTFSQRRLELEQDGQVVFTMTCSFTSAIAEPVYQLPLDPDVPEADENLARQARGPWQVVRLGAAGPSTGRAWFRMTEPLDDDPIAGDAVLAFFSDMTGMGGHPVPLPNVEDWVSLDHAVWFHRPLRADQWLLFDLQTLVAIEKRALIRGVLYGPDRKVGMSMAQEALLRRS